MKGGNMIIEQKIAIGYFIGLLIWGIFSFTTHKPKKGS